jgi:hypothetical protein
VALAIIPTPAAIIIVDINPKKINFPRMMKEKIKKIITTGIEIYKDLFTLRGLNTNTPKQPTETITEKNIDLVWLSTNKVKESWLKSK